MRDTLSAPQVVLQYTLRFWTASFWREVIARSAEQPAVLNQSWFKNIIQSVGRFLFHKGFMPMRLTGKDIAGMAAASVRQQMRVGGKRSGASFC